MSRGVLIALVAAVAVFAGVLWFARDVAIPAAPGAAAASATPPEASRNPREAPPTAATERAPVTTVAGAAAKRPESPDPRLAALMGASGQAMVEYVPGVDGRVIREIDNDPNSQGYRKPLRDYSYAGDKVAAITSYKYFGDQVRIIRAVASYKPDGTVDQYRETTEYVKAD